MKILHIAWKDLKLAYRRLFLIGMAFIAPMLMAFIFSSAFGGAGEFVISKIDLGIVNLDQPSYGFFAGGLMQDLLTGDDFSELLNTSIYLSESEALTAIKNEDIQAAVIFPIGLSAAVTSEGEPTQIRLVNDPASTLAPQIVESILAQISGGFSGSKIISDLTAEELQRRSISINPSLIQAASTDYIQWAEKISGETTGFQLSAPESQAGERKSLREQIVGGVMASMMIFFTFFTGAYGAETLLDEEAEGTLARKITSPTNLATILGGKSLGIVMILLVQMTVLISISAIVFSIDWGGIPYILLAILTTTVASAGLGLFLMSLVKDRRQTGIVFGGVMTVLGMGGGLFTGGVENPPAFLETISKFTPQGWARLVWTSVGADAPMADLLANAGILLLIGIALFATGVFIFKHRFER